jgi:predicted nucleic-acid-binding Zn-ribbon protein
MLKSSKDKKMIIFPCAICRGQLQASSMVPHSKTLQKSSHIFSLLTAKGLCIDCPDCGYPNLIDRDICTDFGIDIDGFTLNEMVILLQFN